MPIIVGVNVGAVIFLLMVVLSLMREIVLLRSEVVSLSTLVKSPPPPSFLRGRAPDELRRAVESELSASTEHQLVAFVTPSCGPCERLVAGLSGAIAEGQIRRDDVLFVIWALPQSGWEAWSADLPAAALPDIDGGLASVCEVRGTPALFVVSRTDWLVVDYDMRGEAEWAVAHLMTSPTPVVAPT